MKIASVYTLYGRRAGAEMFFERTLQAATGLRPSDHWTVFCNREADAVLEAACPQVTRVQVPMLEHQLSKAFWLEWVSRRQVNALDAGVFWNPSGCNYFPGRWRLPTVTTFLDLGEYRVKGKYDLKRMLYRKGFCIPRSVRRSAAFTAISQFTADDMGRFLGLKDNVTVIHCGPSPQSLDVRDELSESWWKQAGLTKGNYLFVPGRTDLIGKGLDLLLGAYDRLRPEWNVHGLKVVFVGSPGDGHDGFIHRCRQLDPEQDHLLYLGRVEDQILAALYQNCLATVLPSRFEGFGFPVLEAMAARAPVLCSDAGSLPEVAGGAALLFRSGDLDDLCRQLDRLLSEPDLRERLRADGLRQEGRFSWNRSAEALLRVFDQAVVGRRPVSNT